MLTFALTSADIAGIRFGISPLTELWRSVRALQSPAAASLHLPWIAETRATVGGHELAALAALQPSTGVTPDFISPPPLGPSADFEEELARMVATPPERVRLEISAILPGRGAPAPPVLQRFIDEPDTAVGELAQLLRSYWSRALAPHWSRIHAVLESDLRYRAGQTASGGTRRLLSDIDRRVQYEDRRLSVDIRWTSVFQLRGQGVVFVPSTFVWPQLAVIDDIAAWQPTIIYPARGSAMLWETPSASSGALEALIGGRRASVLASLSTPRSTTEIAYRFDITASSVSQHLSVLTNAGLVRRQRSGQVVLYQRTATGDMLVAQSSGEPRALAG